LEREEPDKYKRARLKGVEFREHFLQVISDYVPKGYKILEKKRIDGIDHKFGFLVAKAPVIESGVVDPSDILAIVEAKSARAT
jgi:hypothetical protein